MYILVNADKSANAYTLRKFGHNHTVTAEEFKDLVAKGQVARKANKIFTEKDLFERDLNGRTDDFDRLSFCSQLLIILDYDIIDLSLEKETSCTSM